MSGFDHGSNQWAKLLRIKEAYGFALTEALQEAWREALHYPRDYNFAETGGTFPITEGMPNQRRSLYSDSHIRFVAEYQARHGTELVYDKELVTKVWPEHF